MSGRDRMEPHARQPPPPGYGESPWTGTFRQAEAPEAARRRPQGDGRLIALLVGIPTVLALAAPGLARGSLVPTVRMDGPTCATQQAPRGLPSAGRVAPASTIVGSSFLHVAGYARANDVLIPGRTGALFDGGGDDERLMAPAGPSVTSGPEPSPIKLASPASNDPALGCVHREAAPPSPDGAGKPLPRIPAEPRQPVVAESLSTVTGSTVTITGLRIQGMVDLPTASGTVRALKFSMDRAVTEDFRLRVRGPAGRTMRLATDRLTLTGGVAVYATRFVGRLPGVTITLAPDLPFPHGILANSPTTITFSDPAIDLAFMTSHSLTARPALELTLD